MLSLLTNTVALQALQARSETVRELGQVRQRVSTGLRVAGPKDEAAAFQISRKMKADIAGWDAVTESLDRGLATVSVASTGVAAMSDTLIRAREQLMRLASATDERERGLLRQEIQALVAQSDAIAYRSTYQGINLLTAKGPTEPPQPADFIAPMPTAPGSGVLTFTVNAGARAGRVLLQLDLGADDSEVEIYQGTKRQAATGRDINQNGSAQRANGVQVIGFDYDPTDNQGQTLSIRFNERYAGSNGWRITGLVMVYPPEPNGDRNFVKVLSSPSQEKVTVEDRALLSDTLQLRKLTTETIDVALTKMENAVQAVNAAAGYYGSLEAQLERRRDFGGKLRSNLEAQVGALVDADLSREGARLNALLAREALSNLSLGIAGAQSRVLLDLFRPAPSASLGFRTKA